MPPRDDATAGDDGLDDLVVRWVTDLELGRLKADDVYLRLHPGREDEAARELERLRAVFASREAGTGGGAAGAAPGAEPTVAEPGTASAPDAPEPRALREGWTLGRYSIERELGRGAQGTVFLARDTALDRPVALKVLKAAWSGSEAAARRFELEARALARLDHPALAAVHDTGSVLGLGYLAMRFVEGRTLAREIAERTAMPGRAAIRRLAALVEQAARGLHAAHEIGLVHRDVKPGNLMVTPRDEAVVLDFGVARLGTEPSAITLTGDVLGTPDFMAPEQAAGETRRIDRRADVFGLGATLHAALTSEAGGGSGGAAPAAFPERPPARRLNPAVSRDLDAVLQAALDPDADRRYATAALLADDLERARRGLPVTVRPPGPARRFARWCRRAPARAALAIVPPLLLATGFLGLALKNREIAAAVRTAEARSAEAVAAADLARARFAEFQRLDDLARVLDLEARERDLAPPHSGRIPALERWLAEARDLARRLGGHRDALAAVRRRGAPAAGPRRGDGPEADSARHAAFVRDAARAELVGLDPGSERGVRLAGIAAEAEARLAALETGAAARPDFEFPDVEDRWLHESLALLVAKLEALAGPGPGAAGATIAAVERRLDEARTIAERSLSGPAAAAAWAEAVRAIGDPATDPAYGGLRIEPVLGLVPLGRDPRSGLEEFAHLGSGAPPVRGPDGGLVFGEDSGIVLVLIPGGTFRMGARRPRGDEDPADHVDPSAGPLEQPVHEVALDPFFLAKHEMTQAQWLRATGTNPSHGRPDREWEHGYRPTLRNPVENVSAEECAEVLRRMGLVLPTEAQWERAARAGTTTPWWTGETRGSFLASENLADVTLAESEGIAEGFDADRRDGWSGSAPVGSYPPNPFGLHDVIGNVSELCGDDMAFYATPVLPGDGLRLHDLSPLRPVRGGAYHLRVEDGRSSHRRGVHATSRNPTMGVRPALLLEAP